MTDLIPADRWRECLPMIESGGVVAIPTDTVYGIAALPLDARAIERIYEAKGRPSDKALPMLVSAVERAEAIAHLSPAVRRLCAAFWPGALTIVVRAAASFQSPALSDDGTIGVRMPAAPLALEIIAAAGGVLSVTSANRSGMPPATTAQEVLAELGGRIDAVVDGGPSQGGTPSSVVRLTGSRVEILRAGAISPARIRLAARRSPRPAGPGHTTL